MKNNSHAAQKVQNRDHSNHNEITPDEVNKTPGFEQFRIDPTKFAEQSISPTRRGQDVRLKLSIPKLYRQNARIGF